MQNWKIHPGHRENTPVVNIGFIVNEYGKQALSYRNWIQ